MVGVVLAALNLVVMRLTWDSFSLPIAAIGAGAVPMATILGATFVIGYRRRASRPFLCGFEIFGALAIMVYVLLACFCGEATIDPYADLIAGPVADIVDDPDFANPIGYLVAAAALVLPQVVFALIGGWLSSWYKVTITRRIAA